jgi:hypothetical protein
MWRYRLRAVSFRFNYRVNGRQETLTLGRYGVGGMTLAEARMALVEARKMLAGGESPARTKQERAERKKAQETSGVWAQRWLDNYRMAESTRAMRCHTYELDLRKAFGSLLVRNDVGGSEAVWQWPAKPFFRFFIDVLRTTLLSW